MKYNSVIVRAYWAEHRLPVVLEEWRFNPNRRWRFDWAWEDERVALEVQGGIWIRGGHNRGAQMKKDWEKYNAAACLGWRILYCEPRDLCTLEMVETIRSAVNFGKGVDAK